MAGGVGQCHMLRWRLVVSEAMQSQGEAFHLLGQTPGLVVLHRADPRGTTDRSKKARREAQQFRPRGCRWAPRAQPRSEVANRTSERERKESRSAGSVLGLN